MTDQASFFERTARSAEQLRINFSASEFAALAADKGFTEDQICAVEEVFAYLEEEKKQTVINTLLRLSRLPMKVPKTFDNYDFDRLRGKDCAELRKLPSMAELYAGKNLAFIGPPGVGKTHLAEAYGRECCMRGMKTYFLKASEMNDRFTAAIHASRKASVINGLVKPTCLIIDEIGHCVFSKEATSMFFDVTDRRYQKEAPNSTIVTSNLQPHQWSPFFCGGDDLEDSLDRLFDNAKVITIKGTSYRGQTREVLAVEAETAGTRHQEIKQQR